VRERELAWHGQLARSEPAQLDEVIAGACVAADGTSDPGKTEDRTPVVRLEPKAEKLDRLDVEPRFLPHFPQERVDWRFLLVEKAAREIPEVLARIEGAPPEQHATAFVEDDCLRAGHGVGVCDIPARTAFGALVGLLDSLAADGTEPPAVESTHGAHNMSPRAAGATQHELSRVGLLATLSGETLARLAERMMREDIPAGAGVFDEGDEGDRFYVVLRGMLSVTQQTRGAQAVLRPGDYFGEVALAMHMPRTASVRALTPVTVASCDQQTFDEFIRPLFADDEG
jgi:hypothetical protein